MDTFKISKRARNVAFKTAFIASLLLSTSGVSYAQLSADQQNAAQGQANPARVQDQLLEAQPLRRVSAPVQVQDLVLQNMPANAESIRFNLEQIQFDGVGVYKESDIRPVYADKLGTNVSLADIYAIATAMTNKYRNDGYILTQVIVPPQTIEGGIVKLQAVEGFIDQIYVSGDVPPNAIKLIRGYANHIRDDGITSVQDLEKYLLLINDLPGISARSILAPSKTKTGASDLQIIAEHDPYDAFLGVDNYGSRYLGPIQFTAAGSLNSFFGNNERITGQFVTAPHNAELYYGSLAYDQPVGTYGTVASVLYSHSNTEPGFDLDEFDVNGKSDLLSFSAMHPFIRTRAQSLFGRATFDFRDVQSRNILEVTREDRIRSLRIGGRYEFLDSVFTAGANAIDLEFSKGLDVFGASSDGDIRLSRPAGDPEYSKATLSVQRLQRVTSEVNILAAAEGQLSNGALLASEEFGVGGINMGRGFDPSEITGDDGVAGKIEVQWNQPYAVNFLEDYQLFGFYEIGKVWNDDATISDDDESLASAGFGVRADLPSDVKAGMAVAFPLTRDVQTHRNREREPTFYFNLNRSF